jgi:hypothetical protein
MLVNGEIEVRLEPGAVGAASNDVTRAYACRFFD